MSILTQYRPQSLSEVYGHASEVKALKAALKQKEPPQCYLFSGPAGCGKTTLARIVAKERGVKGQDLIEVDAATHSGVDQMRSLARQQEYTSITGGARMIIVDECQALSKNAWQAMLKPLEESPPNFYWALCTTELFKVPKAIITRSFHAQLSELKFTELEDLVADIAEEEDIEIDFQVIRVIVQAANGSPRQALSNLAKCRTARSSKDAAALLQQAGETNEVVELCRMLLFKKGTFQEVLKLVKDFDGVYRAESVRIVVLNYTTKVMLNPKGKCDYIKCLSVLEEFSQPFNDSEGMAPLVLALGNLFLGE